MALGGSGYFSANYFSQQYWHTDYWTETSGGGGLIIRGGKLVADLIGSLVSNLVKDQL